MAREVPLHAYRILMNSVIRVPSPPEIYKLPIWECDSKLFSGLRTLSENDFHFIIYVSNIFSTNRWVYVIYLKKKRYIQVGRVQLAQW